MKNNCFLTFTHKKDRMDKTEEQKCARWIHLCFEFAADVSSLTYKMLFQGTAEKYLFRIRLRPPPTRGYFRQQTSRAAREEIAVRPFKVDQTHQHPEKWTNAKLLESFSRLVQNELGEK